MPEFGGPSSGGGPDLSEELAAVEAAAARGGIEAQRRGTVLDDFGNIGGWVAYTGTSPTLAQTLGPHGNALSLTTPVGVSASAIRTVGFSMKGKALSFKMKTDANLSMVRMDFVVRGRSYGTRLYHDDLTPSRFTPGEWVTQTIVPSALTPSDANATDPIAVEDIRQVWLQAVPVGGAATTIEIADLRLHTSVLEPGVAWTFDDGNRTDYTRGLPILSAVGHVATEYITSAWLNTTADFTTTSQLQEMKAAGWSIGAHSHTHPNLDTVDAATLDLELRTPYDYLGDNGLLPPSGGAHMAYPSGAQNPAVVRAALRYYRTARTTHIRNTEFPTVANMGRLHTRGFDGGMTAATAKGHLDKVKTHGGVLIVMLHQIQDAAEPSLSYHWTLSRFQEAVEHAASIGLKSYTLDDIYPL